MGRVAEEEADGDAAVLVARLPGADVGGVGQARVEEREAVLAVGDVDLGDVLESPLAVGPEECGGRLADGHVEVAAVVPDREAAAGRVEVRVVGREPEVDVDGRLVAVDADARLGVLVLVGPEVEQRLVGEAAGQRRAELLGDLEQERRREAVDGVGAEVPAPVVFLCLVEDRRRQTKLAERGEAARGERGVDDDDLCPRNPFNFAST